MICGSFMADKAGCLSTPKSPASTAGHTSIDEESSFNLSRSISKGELKNDVLVLRTIAWGHTLDSPEEVARLSRATGRVHALFTASHVPRSALVAWRIFQASDRHYNGYTSLEDMKKVTTSVIPSVSRMDFPLDETETPDSSIDTDTILFWDVLLWWRELRMPRQLKSLVEDNVIHRLVVPSDGLWAGVSINASLRIWQNMVRSAGYLYRFCGENYIASACRSMGQTHQGLSRDDSLIARIELVSLFIHECLSRVHFDLPKVWKVFAQIDQDSRGFLNDDQLEELSDKLRLSGSGDEMHYFSLLSCEDPVLSRSESTDDFDTGSGQRFLLVEILSYLIKQHPVPLSGNISVLPGHRNPSSGIWDKMKRKLRLGSASDVGKILIDRLRSGVAVSTADPNAVFRTLVRQYLDLEQWRGQLLATQISLDDHE
jgi:hypothetical protein